MKHTVWISCPRTKDAQRLISFAERQPWLEVAGVGVCDMGTEALHGSAICSGSGHPLLYPRWPDGSAGRSSSAAQDGLAHAAAHFADLTVLSVGPLTDLAKTLCAHPEAAKQVRQILILGGSDSFGDVTPAAEQNIYCDPEAAQLVMKSGIPLVIFGLNTTRALSCRVLAPLCYLKAPELFQTEPAGVYVETRGTCTRGKTVTDLYSDKQFPEKNARFVTGIDMAGFSAFADDA